MSTIVEFMGLPGSGKSALARLLISPPFLKLRVASSLFRSARYSAAAAEVRTDAA